MVASDEVFLEGLQFYAYHGVNPEERTRGQRFAVDVRLEADLREAGRTDDLARTVSYSAVYKRVRAIVEGPPRALVEAVAEEIAAAVLGMPNDRGPGGPIDLGDQTLGLWLQNALVYSTLVAMRLAARNAGPGEGALAELVIGLDRETQAGK